MSITFTHILIVSSLVFGLGMFAILTRKNIVAILMGIELILNAAGLNIVGFSLFHGAAIQGQILALFIVVLAASEAAIAFGILINYYRNIRSVDVNTARRMRR